MTTAFLVLTGAGALLLVWRCIADARADDWSSTEWRNRQTAAKYDARFNERYPR